MMRVVLRRGPQLAGIATCATVGALLILEVTDLIDSAWRDDLARAVERAADPSWALWISALAGAALAVAGVAMFAAQFTSESRGLRTMHEVHRDNDGETMLRGRAAIAAVRHEVREIEGVVEVDASIRRKRMKVEVAVDDRADLEELEAAVRARLDHGFWIDLGLADFAVDLLVRHHPRPPRVR